MKFETLLYLFFIILTIIAPLLKKKKTKQTAKPEIQEDDEDILKRIQREIDKFEPIQPTYQEVKEAQPRPLSSKKTVVTETGQEYETFERPLPDESPVVIENYEQNITSYDTEPIPDYSYEDTYKNKEIGEVVDVVSLVKPTETKKILDEDKDEDEDNMAFTFEPLKAVILSEILKRPDY